MNEIVFAHVRGVFYNRYRLGTASGVTSAVDRIVEVMTGVSFESARNFVKRIKSGDAVDEESGKIAFEFLKWDYCGDFINVDVYDKQTAGEFAKITALSGVSKEEAREVIKDVFRSIAEEIIKREVEMIG